MSQWTDHDERAYRYLTAWDAWRCPPDVSEEEWREVVAGSFTFAWYRFVLAVKDLALIVVRLTGVEKVVDWLDRRRA